MKNNLFNAFNLWGVETDELATAIYNTAKDQDFCDYADTEEIDTTAIKSALDDVLKNAQNGDMNAQALINALVMGHNLI